MVKRNIVTMTNWTPDLTGRDGPRYIAIADALAADIAAGRFRPGDRLPTHRDLAWRLGVTVGTVSRAYAEAERRGLVGGEVGRGTYVRLAAHQQHNLLERGAEDRDNLVDLTFNFPPPAAEGGLLAETLREISADPGGLQTWLAYQPCAGRHAHRAAGATWLGLSGLAVDPDQVVVTSGAQHGVLSALAALTRPGDRVATEALTYPGIKLVAHLLGLRLEGVPMDKDGLRPEAFDALCRGGEIKALYCIPTLQNPTNIIMPAARRSEIAAVAQAHGVAIVEDDLMRLMAPKAPPPLATFAPDRTTYITSLSKTLAPGLRIGFAAGPPETAERLAGAVRTTCWMATPLTMEVGARWIADGTAERILAARRREAEARRARTRTALGKHAHHCPAGSLHLWLHVPEPWRANDLVTEARARGVAITGAEAFAVGRHDTTHAIRVCYGAASDMAALDRALKTIADLLESEPPEALDAVV